MKTLITLLIVLLTSSSLNGRTKNDSVKVIIHRMDSLERYAELFE